MENAVNEHDDKALSSLLAEMEGLKDDLGPESQVTDGLETVDPDSPGGAKFTKIFAHLDENRIFPPTSFHRRSGLARECASRALGGTQPNGHHEGRVG
jgi:hypothetical protein